MYYCCDINKMFSVYSFKKIIEKYNHKSIKKNYPEFAICIQYQNLSNLLLFFSILISDTYKSIYIINDKNASFSVLENNKILKIKFPLDNTKKSYINQIIFCRSKILIDKNGHTFTIEFDDNFINFTTEFFYIEKSINFIKYCLHELCENNCFQMLKKLHDKLNNKPMYLIEDSFTKMLDFFMQNRKSLMINITTKHEQLYYDSNTSKINILDENLKQYIDKHKSIIYRVSISINLQPMMISICFHKTNKKKFMIVFNLIYNEIVLENMQNKQLILTKEDLVSFSQFFFNDIDLKIIEEFLDVFDPYLNILQMYPNISNIINQASMTYRDLFKYADNLKYQYNEYA